MAQETTTNRTTYGTGLSPGTVSGSTITLTNNNSIYTDAYSTNGTITTSTLGGSTVTIDPSFTDELTRYYDEPTTVTIGGQELNAEKIEKLTALLDVLEGLEGSDLAAMLETQILLNKVRHDET